MAYNAKSIEAFIDKVNEEAEAAAQKVYDSYQEEFERRVKAQMLPGSSLSIGMGACVVENKDGVWVGGEFADAVGHIQWIEQRASFTLGDFKIPSQP